MRPFLKRYSDGIDDAFADPHITRRVSHQQRMELLEQVELSIWQEIMAISGSQTTLARADATIKIVSGTSRYALPGNFRKAIEFVRRDSQGNTLERLESRPAITPGNWRGYEVVDPRRGIIIHPISVQPTAGDWILVYHRAPLKLHYAKAAKVGAQSLTASEPGSEGGELVRRSGYYDSAILHVYSASEGGELQIAEIESSAVSADGPMTFRLRHAWDQRPAGDVWYEIQPEIPPPMDALYSIDAAIRIAASRNRSSLRPQLLLDRRQIFKAVQGYFSCTVSDRMDQRVYASDLDDTDPWGE